MRIYQNCREMWNETRRDLHEMGVLVHPATMQDKYVADDPAYRTLELSPCVFTILDGESDKDGWLQEHGGSVAWARAELMERVHRPLAGRSGINPGEAWMLRREVWEEFLHDGRFAYTYSQRFGEEIFARDDFEDDVNATTVLARIVAELRLRPDTRQAVLPVFSAIRDISNLGGAARVPCSLHYQFLRRSDGLRLIYVMRSSDFVTHFCYDVWLALGLQRIVADQLGEKMGRFTFFTGSLHLYARDADPGVF